MTLNGGAIAVILRYFTDFGGYGSQMHQRG